MARMYTILVVDDEPDFLDLVAKILAEPGYTVVTAKAGYEALRILAERPIDLLIADIRMPGINGFQLAAQAKLMRPSVHVIYLTGFYSEAEETTWPRFGALLEKPVRPATLLRAIDREMTA
jgi:CheY-like chemotaxis protein